MFLRQTRRRKDGKTHSYWSVVENQRLQGGRVVQRHVLYLGEISPSQAAAWRKSIEVFDEAAGHPRTLALFPEDRCAAAAPDSSIVQLRLSKMRLCRPRQWGACWLAGQVWQDLHLDRFWSERLPVNRKGTHWDQVLQVLVSYRLIAPGSEWKLHRDWFGRSAMADLLGSDFRLATPHKLYTCHDFLLAHKADLFAHLAARWRDLFNAEFDVLLYDLTSTYFEINAADVPEGDKRRHGYRYHGAEKRPTPWQSGAAEPTTLETTVQTTNPQSKDQTAIHINLNAIFISLELSRSTWLVTALSPGGGQKMSKYSVRGGDVTELLTCFSGLQDKAEKRTERRVPIVIIQEAGLDGFWIHRTLEREGIESHVVDAASIATSRRSRRAKTDRIDGEALVRTLLAYKRGEPRVCAMVRVPTAEEEDRRRISRERKTLTAERVTHVNRIKGLLFTHGIEYEPLHRTRRARLEELRTRDGGPLPTHLKRQISRELDRLELILEQITAVEAERNALLAPATQTELPTPAKMLMDLKGIGAEFAAVLWTEGLFRQFDNRRQVAAYAGLAPTLWQSGTIDREQGVGKSGNPRLGTTMLQLAWLWLRHQPDSALSRWFHERVKHNGGRARKTMITALARKLLVALWKYVTAGVMIEGATVRTAS